MRLEDLPDDGDVCSECGAALPQDSFWGRRFTCSIACQRRAWARRAFEERACGGCGRPFVPPSGEERFCSLACYQPARQAGKPAGFERICVECGGAFKVHSLKLVQVRCSRRCDWVNRRRKLEAARTAIASTDRAEPDFDHLAMVG